MYHYRYATKEETKPVRAELEEIIHEVQDKVREYFTFSYQFIGSYKRNMITFDPTSNVGFDFDVNIYVNDEEEEYSAEEIRTILRNAFNKVVRRYGYTHCEDSTSVLTIKFVDRQFSRINHSCDFAIVYEDNKEQQYIRFNKEQNNYTWEYSSKGYKNLEKRADWLKNHNYWSEVREVYLEMKNNNTNPDKHSRSIYTETINNVYNKYR
ncbi:MAG: hypothetical protein J1E36_05540 [Eubacterium sp.]|nr:hypothetical protein [Eubacterium sp.]